MLIDSIFIIILITAIIKGYSKGFIMAVFSSLSILVGLVAATKLSAVVANYLHENAHVGLYWLPIISFTLVMFATVLLVRVVAKMVQKTFEMAMLGWANRIGGMLLLFCLYLAVFSVALFFAEKINIIGEGSIQSSKFYAFVQPWGPLTIDGIGYVIPIFKGLFAQLSSFFGAVAAKTA